MKKPLRYGLELWRNRRGVCSAARINDAIRCIMADMKRELDNADG